MDRGTDIRDLPWGVFRICRNLTTLSRSGKAITRDGYVALSDRLYEKPFAILPGAAGGRTVVVPEFKDPLPSSDMSLKLVAVPNTGLFANAENPQSVTFIAYPNLQSGVTISTYNWDFSYNNVARVTDATGSATTQDHEYSSSGTYKIQVWGTGSDSVEYNATVQITINVYGENPDEPEDLPEPPIEEEDGNDVDNKLPPTIELTAVPTEITTGDTAKLNYIAKRADTLYLYKSTDDTFEQELTVSGGTTTQGMIEVTPTETTVYSIIATNAYGFPTGYATVTVATPEAVPGYLIIDPDLNKTIIGGVTHYLTEEETNFTVYVYCIEEETTNAIAFPTGKDPVLYVSDLDPLGTTLNVISPSFNDERTLATFSLQQLALADSVTEGTVTLTAALPDVTPAVTSASVKVYAYAPTATLTTTCVDIDGDSLTESETLLSGTAGFGGYVYGTIYLKIEASETDFSNDVQLTASYSAGNPLTREEFNVSYIGASGFEVYGDATTTSGVVSGVVPGSLFAIDDAGFASVEVFVSFPATQDYTTAKYLTVEFDATEIPSE